MIYKMIHDYNQPRDGILVCINFSRGEEISAFPFHYPIFYYVYLYLLHCHPLKECFILKI